MKLHPLFLGVALTSGLAVGVSANEPADEEAVRHVVGEYVAGWRAGDVS